jgi:hypothetical protein
VAYEGLVMDWLNERFGALGVEVIGCETTDETHGSISRHVRELLPCRPEDDWWPEPTPETVARKLYGGDVIQQAAAIIEIGREDNWPSERIARAVLEAAANGGGA